MLIISKIKKGDLLSWSLPRKIGVLTQNNENKVKFVPDYNIHDVVPITIDDVIIYLEFHKTVTTRTIACFRNRQGLMVNRLKVKRVRYYKCLFNDKIIIVSANILRKFNNFSKRKKK
jgi:hypothetical protein